MFRVTGHRLNPSPPLAALAPAVPGYTMAALGGSMACSLLLPAALALSEGGSGQGGFKFLLHAMRVLVQERREPAPAGTPPSTKCDRSLPRHGLRKGRVFTFEHKGARGSTATGEGLNVR